MGVEYHKSGYYSILSLVKLLIMETNNNEIVLKPDSIIAHIQMRFNLFYPFLKIEFLKNPANTSGKNLLLNAALCLTDVSSINSTQKINVDKSRTVSEIADDCKKMGLYIQVLRRSGNIWNVISLTDSWTLENQNNEGQFISSEMAFTARPPNKRSI